MSHQHEPGKILVEPRYKLDIFEDCLHSYADKSGRLRLFPLNRIVLLYSITVFLRNRSSISDEDFALRLRSINNLIQNSEDEVSDKIDRNRLPAILQQTDAIMLTGSIDDKIDNSFSVNQIAEEKEKKLFLEANPAKTADLFALEDHPNLKGQVGIIGLDHVDYADRFASLFRCDWDLIDRALMSVGDYGQQERNKWRYQYGSKSMQIAWDSLFHRSANSGFENTSRILVELLSRAETFTNDVLRGIIDGFIATCEEAKLYPLRYYYVKYDVFRPGSYGKYAINDPDNKPYRYVVMQTRSQWSSSTYMPYLKEVDEAKLDNDSLGQRLVYGDRHIICENAAFVLCDNETKEEIERVAIDQNENGIDTVDRILLLRSFVTQLTAVKQK